MRYVDESNELIGAEWYTSEVKPSEPIITDDEFTDAILSVVFGSNLTAEDLANLLSVSQTTMRRWVAGKNLPMQAIRRPIVAFIKRREL